MNNFNNMLDDVLVKLAQAGDQDALAALFLRYKVIVYICILNVVRNDEIAKDLWQDAYLKAWRHIQDLKKPSLFKPWLLTIARRLAFDWLRKNSRMKVLPLEEHVSTSDPIDWTAALDVVIDADRVRYVLAEMEPVYRDVLLLHAMGYSRVEIAQQLGYAEGTITTYVSEARKQFRHLSGMIDHADENRKENEFNG